MKKWLFILIFLTGCSTIYTEKDFRIMTISQGLCAERGGIEWVTVEHSMNGVELTAHCKDGMGLMINLK